MEDNSGYMKFIFSYMKKYRKLVAAVMLIKLAGTLGELMLPYVLEHLVDDVVPEKDVKLVCLWGSIMILLAIFVRQANVRANRLSVRVAKECTYEIRRDLFWKSINLSGSQLDEFGLPSLDSRMTSDSYNLQSFIQSVQSLGIRAPILLLGGILITLTMDTGLAAILNVGLTVVVLVGAVRVNEGTTQPGVILAFLTYFNISNRKREMLKKWAFLAFSVSNLLLVQCKNYYFNRFTVSRNWSIVL